MTIQEMLERKKELGYSYEQVSELSGVPLGTVQKVLGGITQSPRYDTLRALEEVFQKGIRYEYKSQDSVVREGVTYYGAKRQGEYTIEDYYALPDEPRVELIDGVIYNMASPNAFHQMIALQIASELNNYIRGNHGYCIPFIAPMDVQLDMDEHTMLQPDVIVVCDRNQIREDVIFGAPDFVVEILSPSTKRKDMTIKLGKYMDAGVKEYWMIDPKKKSIVVYLLNEEEKDYDITLYTFENEVPVGIYKGQCKVNFKAIDNYVSFLYGN
jgi:Uma2 family endonuclease